MNVNYYNTNCFSKDESALKAALASFFQRIEEEALPFSTLDFVDELIISVEEMNSKIQQFKHMLLLGVGGSALGPQALQKSFSPQDRHPIYSTIKDYKKSEYTDKKQLWIADNVDTHFFSECLTALPPEETIVLVISKSGSTLETLAQYFICKEWMQKKIPQAWQEHFLVITDQNEGFLRKEVQEHQYKSLPVPQKLGGRFSIFSAVGMLPSAFLGIDYKNFLQGAKTAKETFFKETEAYLASREKTNGDQTKIEQEKKTPLDSSLPLNSSLPHVFKMAFFAFEAIENNFSQLIFLIISLNGHH